MDDSMTQAASEEAVVVLAWHAALNDGDLERLLKLTTPDVEVGGPRGTGRGAELLRDWVGHAGIRYPDLDAALRAAGIRVAADG
jgi:ketosteroid isomerase-like protein